MSSLRTGHSISVDLCLEDGILYLQELSDTIKALSESYVHGGLKQITCALVEDSLSPTISVDVDHCVLANVSM